MTNDDFWLQFWRFGCKECGNKFVVITQNCFSCMSLKNDLGLLVKNKSIVDLSLQG